VLVCAAVLLLALSNGGGDDLEGVATLRGACSVSRTCS
jgi:hypothetical protein